MLVTSPQCFVDQVRKLFCEKLCSARVASCLAFNHRLPKVWEAPDRGNGHEPHTLKRALCGARGTQCVINGSETTCPRTCWASSRRCPREIESALSWDALTLLPTMSMPGPAGVTKTTRRKCSRGGSPTRTLRKDCKHLQQLLQFSDR